MTKAEFIEDLKLRSSSFNDTDSDKLDAYVDSALREYSKFRPLRIVSKNNSRSTDGDEYDPPDNYQSILWVKESYSQTPIEHRLENKLEDDDSYETKLILGILDRPSWEEVVHGTYYESPNFRMGRQYDYSYSNFDVCFTRLHTINTVPDININTLQLWAEYLENESKASREGGYSDLTDREPSGAETSITESRQGNIYSTIARDAKKDFYREVRLPYGTRDTTPAAYNSGYGGIYGYIYTGAIFNG